MSKLGEILRQTDLSADLGSGNSKAALRKNLERHRVHLLYTFIFWFIVVIALIAAGSFGIWYFQVNGSADQVKALTATLGLTGGSAGLIEILRRVWSEWSRTTLVIMLITDADRDIVIALVQTLSEKLK
jgi:hypothetical protein